MEKVIFEKTSALAKLPTRANPEDSGLDFYSPIDFTIRGGSDILVSLDLKVELPSGTDLVFHAKSGRATKNKIIPGACVVDRGYEGVIHAHLFNLGHDDVYVKTGEKIIQGIIRRVEFPEIEEGKINSSSSRGEGGFGSTGLK